MRRADHATQGWYTAAIHEVTRPGTGAPQTTTMPTAPATMYTPGIHRTLSMTGSGSDLQESLSLPTNPIVLFWLIVGLLFEQGEGDPCEPLQPVSHIM